MSDKQTIEIDFKDIRKEVNNYFVTTAAEILKKSIDLNDLSEKTSKILRGSIMKEPEIVKVIADQCEWSIGNAFKEVFESSSFKDHLKILASEVINDDAFNKQLKEQMKTSFLKRV